MTIDYVQGSLIPKDDLTLPYIWVSLHLNAQMEQETLANPRLSRETARMANEITYLLEVLQKVPMQKWHSLCTAAGMTVYGAIALSWCKDADLTQVWEGWEASGFPLKPLPEFERPARFINPALLPATNSLKKIITIAENKSLPICAMMVAKRDSLEIDLPDSMLKSASPQIAAFLKAHVERKLDQTAEDAALLEAWSKTITGTDWEV